jgi:hypothetical protein
MNRAKQLWDNLLDEIRQSLALWDWIGDFAIFLKLTHQLFLPLIVAILYTPDMFSDSISCKWNYGSNI